MAVRNPCGSRMELRPLVTRTIWLRIDMLVLITE